MAKFKVGDSPRSIIPICGHQCPGGTWFSPVDVGSSEEVLKKQYPWLVWSKSKNPEQDDLKAKEKEKEKPKEVPKEAEVKEEPKVEKMSAEEFEDLNRKAQEKELDKLGIKYSKKDKEADLIKKYLA